MDEVVILTKREFEELRRKASNWERYLEYETLEELN
jgi:hypothetical protein